MTRLAVLTVLLAAAAWPWGAKRADTVKALQAQFNAGQFQAVIDALDPDGLQKLRGQDLRKGYVLLGASYEKQGRIDKTLSVYQLGAALFPRDQDLLARLAQLMHRSGLDEQARPLYEKILNVNPVNPYGHWGLGQIDRSLGFLDRAAEHYEKTLEDFSDRAEIWREYAELLYAARDYGTAEPAARRALALYQESEPGVLILALILRARGRVEEALAEIEPLAVAGKPAALRAKTLWLLESGRGTDSLAAAAALLRAAPDDPVALYARARVRLAAGRRAEAVEDLERAARSTAAPFSARICGRLARLAGGRRGAER